MGNLAFIRDTKSFGYHTETAGTVIQENVPGKDGLRIGLEYLGYTAAATAHTLAVLYPGSLAGCRTTADGAAAASQKDILCADAPTDPAGNAAASGDHIAYQVSDGTWEFNTVASISTKTITLTNNIATALLDGAKVRIFGVVGDGQNFRFAAGAAGTSTFSNNQTIVKVDSTFEGDPVILQSDNATNAGFLLSAMFSYS